VTIPAPKAIFAAILSAILTACGTPDQNDLEGEISGLVENGMPVQETIFRLKAFGFTCTEYPKNVDCTRLKQRVIPPVSCIERVSFIPGAQGLVSKLEIAKIACTGM
jgi:hypothetical protein